MNPHNPIDGFFKKRLENYSQEAPMHLWQGVEHRRTAIRRLALRGRRKRPARLGLLFLLGASAAVFFMPEPGPQLQSFPIPLGAGEPTAVLLKPRVSEEHPAERAYAADGKLPAENKGRQKPTAAPPAKVAAPAAGRRQNPTPAETAKQPLLTTAPVPSSDHKYRIAPRPAFELPEIAPPPPPQSLQCVTFGENHQWKLFGDVHAAPEVPIRQMEARDPEFADYAEVRKDTETPQLSFSTGTRLSLVSDFGLAFRTGLHYTQINEKFDFTDNSEQKITITNIFGPNGEIIGTDTLVQTGQHRQTANNRYRMLDVPLLLGYEIIYDKWTVAFNAGAMINLLFQAKGDFLSPDDLRPVGFSSDDSSSLPAYRRNIGVGWYAGIGIHYHLRQDLQILLEPHFRINPQSVTHPEYVLNQRYMTTGLSVGVRKRI